MHEAAVDVQLMVAVRFASVCRAFRAAAHNPALWAHGSQLELHWVVTGAVSSCSLISHWVPCFRRVHLWGAQRNEHPSAYLDNLDRERDAEEVFIGVGSRQRQGDVLILETCLGIAHQRSHIPMLTLFCSWMSPAEVQLLAGLRVARLRIRVSSGFTLDALPAATSTELVFCWRHSRTPGADERLLELTWEAMTAARTSSFHFRGGSGRGGHTVVKGYAAHDPGATCIAV